MVTLRVNLVIPGYVIEHDTSRASQLDTSRDSYPSLARFFSPLPGCRDTRKLIDRASLADFSSALRYDRPQKLINFAAEDWKSARKMRVPCNINDSPLPLHFSTHIGRINFPITQTLIYVFMFTQFRVSSVSKRITDVCTFGVHGLVCLQVNCSSTKKY